MSQGSASSRKHPFPIVSALIAVVAGFLLLTVGGFAFAASQEAHDPFCGSCHTQPESTFLQRSTSAQPVDLASYHTTQQTRCIDCHSGKGIAGRVQAELMGAHNALLWITGTAVQPAVLTTPIGDDHCLKCHQEVTSRGYTPREQITLQGVRIERREEEEGGNNHWHELLSRWQSRAADAGSCVACHTGHTPGSTAGQGFMDAQTVQAECDACHRVLRHERGNG